MGIIGWIVLGLIAGAIAKAIMPGRQGGGIFLTMVLGIVGGILGGWIGSAVFHAPMSHFWSLSSWICAIVGSLIVLFVWGLLTGRKTR